MIDRDDYVNRFIEKYIDLIDTSEWTTFYNLVIDNVVLSKYQWQGFITERLMEAGIYPHQEMDNVPECYLQSTNKVHDITIPRNCKAINSYAFALSELENCILEEGLEYIYKYAFLSCTELTTLTLPRSITFIEKAAFLNTQIKFKVYENSYAQQWCEENMYSWELVE